MVLYSAAFMAFRVLEILLGIPIIGMLGWFVDSYVQNSADVTDRPLLAFFVISILATAWALLTIYQFHRYRDVSGPFIALIDLAFVGAWIAVIVLHSRFSNAECSNVNVPVSVQYGDNTYSGGSSWSAQVNKPCAMMKASWALAIIECILFFLTACLSWTLYRSYRYGVITSKEYVGGRQPVTSTYRHRRHRGAY